MTGHTQPAMTTRERFLQEAKRELINFERKESEFRKKQWKEREAELLIPFGGAQI